MDPLENSQIFELVRKAQNGCSDSMDILAQQAKPVLFGYIYRITLNHSLTEDLQQETLLAMVKSLGNLRKPEHFWAWLYRTALSKVQHHYRHEQREREKQAMSAMDKDKMLQNAARSQYEGLSHMIQKELSQAILDAMTKLKLKHRNILVLRCYEQRSYAEIAEIMDCSRTSAQVMFFRAKHALKSKLSRNGFGKGMLLAGMGLFGLMTTPKNTAAVTVSANSLKVGGAATVIGAAGTKIGAAIAALFAAAAITVYSVTLNMNQSARWPSEQLPARSEIKSFHYVEQAWDKSGSPNPNLARGRSLSKGAYEQWYYFPEEIDGPVLMMMQRWDPQQNNKLCGWLQNSNGNYYYQAGEKKIYQYNYHLPMRYLTTRRLPSDPPEFTAFLDEIEGKNLHIDYTRDDETGLLTGVLDNRFYNAQHFKSTFSYNKVDEKRFESFRYTWPDAPVIDERDEIHKRGWTFFEINGRLNGRPVYGSGRIPFIYDMVAEHSPWMKLTVGDKLRIIDTDFGACLLDTDDTLVAAYPPGSFFKGLSQPWMGMHTIDMIRRHAAAERIRFDTAKSDQGPGEKVEITLFDSSGQAAIRYTVDIEKDLIDQIEFIGENETIGVLQFAYPQNCDPASDKFIAPSKISIPQSKCRDSMGISWLLEFAEGSLAQ